MSKTERVDTAKLMEEERLRAIDRLKDRILKKFSKGLLADGSCGLRDLSPQFPTVAELLMASALPGGPEKGMKLSIWGDNEGLHMAAMVYPLDVQAFYVADTLQEALQSLENHLNDPDAKWQKLKDWGAAKSKRK